MRTIRCIGRREGGVSQHALDNGGSLPGECLPTGVSVQGGGCLPDTPCKQNDWQTPVKILPCRNFVADGNKQTLVTNHSA